MNPRARIALFELAAQTSPSLVQLFTKNQVCLSPQMPPKRPRHCVKQSDHQDSSLQPETPNLNPLLKPVEPHSTTEKPTLRSSLTPDILPLVISHLDAVPDLEILLICQRVSRTGWDIATRKIYRDISIKSWSKLFWIPHGSLSYLETTSGFTSRNRAPKWRPLDRDSFRRRLAAFSFVKTMFIHYLPTEQCFPAYLLISLSAVVFRSSQQWPRTTLVDVEKTVTTGNIFPQMQHLRVAPSAFTVASIPRSFSSDSWFPQLLCRAFRPANICISFPSGPGPDDLADMDERDVDVSKAVAILTVHPKSHVYFHDPPGIYLMGMALPAHHYHIFQGSDDRTPGPFILRCATYSLLLRKTIEGVALPKLYSLGQTPTLDLPRWTISGEHGWSSETQGASLSQVVDTIIELALHLGVLEPAQLVRSSTKEDVGVNQLRFRYPGHEEVCPICGSSE